MKRIAIALACVLALVSVAAAQLGAARAAGGPTISSLSGSTLPRSGRLLVSGTGFGAVQGTSTLSIGGHTAFVTRWSDTLVVGYVPEATTLGSVGVQVLVGGVGSNVVLLGVTLRQPNGRVKWTFQADAEYGYVDQRPAVGPDGTVVFADPFGHVYALSAAGGLKWIFRTGGADGVPSFGADGTVYVAAMNTIFAIAADGTLKWTFTEPGDGQGVLVGPTVGPDGNIYAVTDYGGLGALALSPAGQLLWSNPGNPIFHEMAQQGAEVAFGPSYAGGAVDRLYAATDLGGPQGGFIHALTLTGTEQWSVPGGGVDGSMLGQAQPTVGKDATVYLTDAGAMMAFDPATGALAWSYMPWPSNGFSAPTVGPDGTIYVGRSLAYLDAVNPNGTTKWSVLDGGVLAHPTISPTGSVIVAGQQSNYGEPGNVHAYDPATGAVRWSLGLPPEYGSFQVLESRPRFATDGNTVYFGTFISNPNSPDQYANLYAVDTSSQAPPPPSGPALKSVTVVPNQVRGGLSANGTVTLTAAAPAGGAIVKLASSAPGVASVPPTVTVRAGATSAAFKVLTKLVFRATSVTISSSFAGGTKTASLTVTR
jgi:outer membrane protein assembly factor BamB